MKENKRFCIITVGITLSLLVLVGLVIVVLDPLFHFHKPWLGMGPVGYDEIYQNPGIAEMFDYDSIITGSSMTENFRASWFDKAFHCSTVKLSYSGGWSKNYSTIFAKVFQQGPIKNIFYGLDVFALQEDYSTTHGELPEYLYDNLATNDLSCILNKSVLLAGVPPMIAENLASPPPTLDEAFVWEENFTFSREVTMADYKRPEVSEKKTTFDECLEQCRQNLNNITPHIEAHPETTFYIFFPPYSILFWDMEIRNGTLETTMATVEYAVEALLQYPNVKLFYFPNDAEIVTNLDNYKDFSHYGPDINRYMVDSMAGGKYLLTAENYQSELKKMYELASQYDYEALFAE